MKNLYMIILISLLLMCGCNNETEDTEDTDVLYAPTTYTNENAFIVDDENNKIVYLNTIELLHQDFQQIALCSKVNLTVLGYVRNDGDQNYTTENIGKYTYNRSSDNNIVTVENSILIPKSVGTATITVSLGSFTTSFVVQVYSLEQNFSSCGFLIERNTSDVNTSEKAYNSFIDNHNRILVVGAIESNTDDLGANRSIAIWRYDKNGSLDLTLNTDGYLILEKFMPDALKETGYDIKVDQNDRILICGQSENNTSSSMFVARLNDNGTFDSTFNTTGYFMYTTQKYEKALTRANSLEIDSNGKIVVAGSIGYETKVNGSIWRLNEDGSLDTIFNNTGFVEVNNSENSDLWNTLLLHNNYPTIIQTEWKDYLDSVKIVRYTDSGVLDVTFNQSGMIEIQNNSCFDGSYTKENKLLILCNKSIFAYDLNGTTDNVFGELGQVTFATSGARSLAVDKNNNLYISGSNSISTKVNTGFLRRYPYLMKLDKFGALDNAFGYQGMFKYFFYDYDTVITNILLDNEDKILLNGGVSDSSGIFTQLLLQH